MECMHILIIVCAKYLIIVPPIVFLVYAWIAAKPVRQNLLLLASISLPLAYTASKIADWAYYNPRPFVVEGVAPLVAHVADNGFPSNHMLLAATLAMLVFVYNRPLGSVLWAVAATVGLARVLAFVHHGVDIVGSVGIAVVVVWGVYLSIRKTPWYH